MTALSTPRLLLRPMSASDAEHVAAGRPPDGVRWAAGYPSAGGSASDAEHVAAGRPPDGVRWAAGYPSAGERAAATRLLNTCADTGDPSPFGSYEIRLGEDGPVIGGMGFHGVPDEDGHVAIGYGLVPSVRGMGYASEALRALLGFARARGVACVHGDTDLDNIASQRVMAAAGMRFVEQDSRLKHYRVDWDGPAQE